MKLFALALLASPLFGADIVSAYTHIPGGGFRIPLPETQLPWKDLALKIVGKDVEKPGDRLLDLWQNQNSLGTTELNFQVPIPTEFKDRRYYVISQYGLTPLRIRNLVGAVRYNFDPNGTKPEIKQVGFGGNAIFDPIPEDEYVEGAFAWVTDSPVTSDAVDVPETDLKITPDGTAVRLTYTTGGNARTARITTPTTSKTEAAALLTIGQERFLFLQWQRERTSCAYTFTLLKLTPAALEEVANTVYGCEL